MQELATEKDIWKGVTDKCNEEPKLFHKFVNDFPLKDRLSMLIVEKWAAVCYGRIEDKCLEDCEELSCGETEFLRHQRTLSSF